MLNLSCCILSCSTFNSGFLRDVNYSDDVWLSGPALFSQVKKTCIHCAPLCWLHLSSVEEVIDRDRRRHRPQACLWFPLRNSLLQRAGQGNALHHMKPEGQRRRVKGGGGRAAISFLLCVLTTGLCLGPVHGVICATTLTNSLQAKMKGKHIPSFYFPQLLILSLL